MAEKYSDEETQELLTMIHVGIAFVSAGGVGWLVLTGADWLVAHSILVRSQTVVEIPATQGAGLDVARLVVVVSVLVLGVAFLMRLARRWRLRRELLDDMAGKGGRGGFGR